MCSRVGIDYGSGTEVSATAQNRHFARAWPLELQRFRLALKLQDTGAEMRHRQYDVPIIASVRTADALAAAIAGDEAVAVPLAQKPLRGDSERRLIAELIAGALRESTSGPPAMRADAREWLRDGLALMSARYCFEALGLDYDSAIAKLEAAWRAEALRK